MRHSVLIRLQIRPKFDPTLKSFELTSSKSTNSSSVIVVLTDQSSSSATNTTEPFQNRRVGGISSSFSATNVVNRIGDVRHLDIGVGLVSGLNRVVSKRLLGLLGHATGIQITPECPASAMQSKIVVLAGGVDPSLIGESFQQPTNTPFRD